MEEYDFMNKRRIKMFVILYENILQLREGVINYLSETLPSLYRGHWWEKGVLSLAHNASNKNFIERLKHDESIHSLSCFDFADLLKILNHNWRNIVLHKNNFNTEIKSKKSLFYKIKEIRDNVAHANDNVIKTNEFKKYIGFLTEFLEIIDPAGGQIGKLNKYIKFNEQKNKTESQLDLNNKKQKLVKLIEDEVIEPALNCEALDEDVKESVVRTLIKFEILDSVDKVNDFFAGALASTRGEYVYKKLHENKLKAFEDIREEYNKIYLEYDNESVSTP